MIGILVVLIYAMLIFFDLKATFHKEDKSKLAVYFTLMVLSCAVSIASVYVQELPSPIAPITNLFMKLLGQ